MKLKYLVTGTGRCGTVYMARFLTEINVPCGHEAIFNQMGLNNAIQKLTGNWQNIQTSQCSRWNHVTQESTEGWFSPENLMAESSYMAAPFLDDPILDGVKVIHLMRNPLLVLSSWVLDIHFFDPKVKTIAHFREFILSHVPAVKKEKTEIEKAARYIIEWNKLIEKTKREKIIVKIEDYPYVKMVNFLDEELDLSRVQTLGRKKINSWAKRKKDLNISDIPEGETKLEFQDFINKYYGIKLI